MSFRNVCSTGLLYAHLPFLHLWIFFQLTTIKIYEIFYPIIKWKFKSMYAGQKYPLYPLHTKIF